MNNAFYTCPYCKKDYTDPSDLAHCILSCEDKKKREEKERKKAELALQKETRKKEVEDALDKYYALLSAYLKDYGSLTIDENETNGLKAFFASRPWHWWFQ